MVLTYVRLRSGRGNARIARRGIRWLKVLQNQPPSGKNRYNALAATSLVQTLAEVDAVEVPRTPTGIAEFDRVLGGSRAK